MGGNRSLIPIWGESWSVRASFAVVAADLAGPLGPVFCVSAVVRWFWWLGGVFVVLGAW